MRGRAVLDSSVLVSALLWHGKPAQLLELFRAGQYELVASRWLLRELEGVLVRPKFRLHPDDAHDFATLLAEEAVMVEPAVIPRVVRRDPNDDPVVAAAREGGAQWIVTGDADLLEIGTHCGIHIVTVDAFLRAHEEAEAAEGPERQ